MKNFTQRPAPSKLLAKFDRELLNILTEDLKAFYAKNPHIRKATEQQKLAA